ncbi:MAG: universal stress protein [Clostridia bacterium]|nr:universal stress protein [Clostridia bacterium]
MSQTGMILVCVTGQNSCDRLIRRGRELALSTGMPLRVLHVRTTDRTLMGNPDISEALNYLYGLAREAEAEMEIISSPEVEDTICSYAREHGAQMLVMGNSPRHRPETRLVERVQLRLPEAAFEIVGD